MIRTVFEKQSEYLLSIMSLYCPKGFEVDATFGRGNFYRHGVPLPRRTYDISPQNMLPTQSDCRNLPEEDASVESLIFDPPFLAGGGESGIMHGHYSSFRTLDDLLEMYRSSIFEFYRILRPGGILVFKCQDFVNGRTPRFTHCDIMTMAQTTGLAAKDLFILINRKLPTPHNFRNQNHARKAHSFFWVFRKPKRERQLK